MVDRQGVGIDHCPARRGVWLDRGELDKLPERAAVNSRTTDSPRHGHPDFIESDLRTSAPPLSRRHKSSFDDIFD
jgi:Zn-finger nucleic acid-binding protein